MNKIIFFVLLSALVSCSSSSNDTNASSGGNDSARDSGYARVQETELTGHRGTHSPQLPAKAASSAAMTPEMRRAADELSVTAGKNFGIHHKKNVDEKKKKNSEMASKFDDDIFLSTVGNLLLSDNAAPVDSTDVSQSEALAASTGIVVFISRSYGQFGVDFDRQKLYDAYVDAYKNPLATDAGPLSGQLVKGMIKFKKDFIDN